MATFNLTSYENGKTIKTVNADFMIDAKTQLENLGYDCQNDYFIDPAVNTSTVVIEDVQGNKVFEQFFSHEIDAHNFFEDLEKIKSPLTFNAFAMNLSEWSNDEAIGTVSVVFIGKNQNYTRRTLYRYA